MTIQAGLKFRFVALVETILPPRRYYLSGMQVEHRNAGLKQTSKARN